MVFIFVFNLNLNHLYNTYLNKHELNIRMNNYELIYLNKIN